MYIAVIEDPEQMSSKIGLEVRAGAPRNVAGQMIVIPDGDKICPDCLCSYAEDVLCGKSERSQSYRLSHLSKSRCS